jgi:hypothetical protein
LLLAVWNALLLDIEDQTTLSDGQEACAAASLGKEASAGPAGALAGFGALICLAGFIGAMVPLAIGDIAPAGAGLVCAAADRLIATAAIMPSEIRVKVEMLILLILVDISHMASPPGHLRGRLPAIRQLLQRRQRLDGPQVVFERSMVAV